MEKQRSWSFGPEPVMTLWGLGPDFDTPGAVQGATGDENNQTNQSGNDKGGGSEGGTGDNNNNQGSTSTTPDAKTTAKILSAIQTGDLEALGAIDPEIAKKYQGVLDNYARKAADTREKNVKKQQEREKLESEGKYLEIVEADRRDFAEEHKRTLGKTLGIPDEILSVIPIPQDVLKVPFSDAKDKIRQILEPIAEKYTSSVEAATAGKIKDLQSGSFKGPNGQSTPLSMEAIKKMSIDEIRARKKEIDEFLSKQ